MKYGGGGGGGGKSEDEGLGDGCFVINGFKVLVRV